MNIAIIGAGNVGKTLGPALRAKGHTVSYGTRDPAKAEQLNSIQLALNKHGRDFASSWRAVMPQTGMPIRALGWCNPIPKKRSSHGYPC